jgi:hypothetical protein
MMLSSLLAWGAAGIATMSVAGAGIAMVATSDPSDEDLTSQDLMQVSETQTPVFDGPGPYPTLEPRPVIQPDTSRSPVELEPGVFARPIVDEFGTQGIEIFDVATEASFGWIPGRDPAVFQGNPERDAGCACEVYGRGWTRVMAFAGDEDALARLNSGLSYEDPDRPVGPPPALPVDRCSGDDPACPTPAPPRSP